MAWGKGSAEPKSPQSGLEMGLRLAMKIAGVDSEEVFGQVKQFAENGTLQKIVDYAEAVELNNFLLGLIYNEFRKSSPELPSLADAVAAFKSRARPGTGGRSEPVAPGLIGDGRNDNDVSDD